jgi:capsular polysaccharide transport system permease protein
MSTLLRGAEVQLRVIGALALRETRTRFGGHVLGYAWALAEPLFWIATFYGLFYLVDRTAPERLDIVPFLATGIVPYELVMKTQDRDSNAIAGNKALLFYPQVQPLDLVYARVALELATYTLILAIILGTNALVDGTLDIASIPLLVAGLALSAALGGALGLVLCSLQLMFPTVERMKGPLMRPLFWVSGIFFTAHMMPSRLRDVILWNPVLHCVEMVRAGWFVGYRADHVQPGYVLGWIVALLFVGLTLERSVRHRIEVT